MALRTSRRTGIVLLTAVAQIVACAHARAQVPARESDQTRELHATPPGTGYYRFPAVHGDMVVFTAEGDLWRVPLSGGLAQRLTTHPGEETRAAISADGRTIAFSATYEGPTEVYTMPVDGGPPVRRTYHGTSARVVGWAPDGRILYATSKFATLPATQLVAYSPSTGSSDVLPLSEAADGSFGEDGTLYFTRFDFQGSHTKRYRGGTAQNIWKYIESESEGEKQEAVPLTAAYLGTSRHPLVWRNRVYFVSDRSAATAEDSPAGVSNIWSADVNGGGIVQHTFHADYDVQTPSLHDGRLVYQQGADLWLLPLTAPAGTNAVARRLDIRLASDFDHLRERWITAPMDYFTSAHLSPTGDRVVLTARGQVFVAPVETGRFVHATPQSKERWVRFREARFMPDGRELLALSDESGEVELWTVPANGIGARTQLTTDADILRWNAMPSPDGRWILHHDKNQKLYLYDVARRSSRVVATSLYASSWISSAPGFDDVAWSSDSRFVAFNDIAPNMMGRLAVFDTRDGTTTHVTTDRYDSWSPAWSADGQWLFFLSDRTLQSTVGSPWGMRAPEPFFDEQTRVYGVALVPGAKWPFAPATELDGSIGESKSDSEGEAREGGAAVSRADLEGAVTRLYEVPLPAGNYSEMSTDGTRLYFMSLAGRTPLRSNLMSLELKHDAKSETYLENVAGYELSQDRKMLLVRRANEFFVLNAGAKAATNIAERRPDLSGWSFAVDPRAEWRQMFVDAWRLERDYFYDPAMHGVDWNAMRAKYEPLAARVTDRAELSDVISQLVGELSALHIFVRGGDMRRGDETVLPASLGAVLEKVPAGWQIRHIYRSDPDIPEELGPLAKPGLDIAESDIIVAINGVSVADVADPSELLRNQAGRQVRLEVRSGDRARARTGARAADASRSVIVTPITQGREADLRYDEWEYTRRLAVDSMSDGRFGYVHIRNMGSGGMTEFAREYYPVFNRDGLIIDVRNNTGGNIDAWLLGRLMRQAWFYWQPRVGEPYWNMQYAFRGPMVVLVNENTASDGEAFAEGFRRLGLGKVIGTRTWGGEVWLSSSNFLLDRGIATAAEQGVYGPEGEWLIEGWGVDPDVVVDNLPVETGRGRDRQLEEAIAELLRSAGVNRQDLPRVRR